MLFESRGMHNIMAELSRVEHIENIIIFNINNFLYQYVYGYRYGYGEAELTDYAINKFNIQEDDINIQSCIARDILVQSLMRYQYKLIKIISDGFSGKTILDKINCLNEALRDYELLDEKLKYLKNNGFSLHYFFLSEVVDEIEKVIEEHIEDIEDVESGKVIKTICQKKQDLEEEHKREMEAYEEMDRINSSYWSTYEDSIRQIRGLDEDCPIF